ncbi:hypothetical protein IV203_030846 [Nitzschia inconspicua]|uniref:Uncharacterized protein n=1 Tax=Nitzschia inconspicua TaxID=303405 RepID=A0A9K3LUC5_9STRA|nr:hypothetical protein IV203_030846 [Nitzschia inconspicua]
MTSTSIEVPAETIQSMDFDYIGTGGFVIVCGVGSNDTNAGEVLGVTAQQAKKMSENCPFIKKCLSANDIEEDDTSPFESPAPLQMKEAKDRIIHKPDWSLAIARHFVEVTTKGKTAISSLELYEQLMQAGDQALVDLRLSSLVNYIDACPSDNDFLRLVHPDFYCFRFQAIVSGDEWLALLEQGVLLYREETNFVVQLYSDEPLHADQDLSRRKLDTRRSEFLVHADRPIDAILKIQKVLGDGPEIVSTMEVFSMYFETMNRIPEDHHQLIDRLAGGEAYIRTCADAVEHRTEGYTVKASLDVLLRAVRPVASSSVVHCSLRIDNPTPDTLGRFVNACRKAKEFPDTLGMDVNINRYFCRKSMEDIQLVLEYMVDYSTSSKIDGDFRILELSSESHSF